MIAETAVPRVGVVVVTYNSKPHLPRLTAALEAQTLPHRLIVLDNASVEEHRPSIADLPAGAQLIQSAENLGFAAGNNRAAALLDTEFVALLNPDAFPSPTWLEELVLAADRTPRAASIGSTQLDASNPDLLDGLGDCYHAAGIPWRGGYGARRSQVESKAGETFSACAAAALYRLSAWRAIGGFDESFFCYCEDVDLGFRLRLAGYAVLQEPRAIVAHIGGGSSGKRSDFSVYYGTRNRLWTFVKNMPAPLFWPLLPVHIAMTCLFLVISPFRGTGPATWRGVWSGVLGLPRIFRARGNVQASRRVKTAALARVLAWSPLALVNRAPIIRGYDGV